MSIFMYYPTDDSKKRKRQLDDIVEDMAYLPPQSSTFLHAPVLPRKLSHRPRDDVDDFLSSDLELSFASTVSLNSPPASPPRDQTIHPQQEHSSPIPMDISPAPPPANPSRFSGNGLKPANRPRALTSARTFGRELGNQSGSTPTLDKSGSSSQAASKRLQRAALPFEWMAQAPQPKPAENRLVVPPVIVPPASPNAMDVDVVDTWVPVNVPVHAFDPSSPVPASAAPTVTGFSNLFFESMSPNPVSNTPAAHLPKKRRSLSPDSSRHHHEADISSELQGSSPAPPSSPSQRKFERFASTGHGAAGGLFRKRSQPLLQGLEESSSTSTANKRLRRPTISALIPPVTGGHQHSAFPILTSSKEQANDVSVLPPPRRAFSAMVNPTALNAFAADVSSDDTSLEGPDMSSPAAQAFAKRQSMKTIRRRDGTDDFRPLTGAAAWKQHDVNVAVRESPSTKYMGAGLPGFGDNEAHGKILPCHRVTEDGLMRIDCKTLNALLSGEYDSQINDFMVIDCRFDYEYAGGHVPGAININTTADIEEFFLGHGRLKPAPSCSGDTVKKTVLIFHCEFSAKRAPTFAKHLRAKDRAMNNHVYPRILFPEVYILSGGYCQYYKESAAQCQPSGYVTMDDPAYVNARREDMDQFRKARFGRTKSYAYGETMGMTKPQVLLQTQRNTAPSGGGCVTSLFAAANAARTRRGGGVGAGLSKVDEDGNSTSVSDDEGDSGLGDSPCPPPSKGAALIGKRISRGPLMRSQTHGPMLR